MQGLIAGERRRSLLQIARDLNWGLILLILITAGIGFAVLYSAGNGAVDPWMGRQALRFALGGVLMILIACLDLRLYFGFAYLLYAAALVLLVYVEFFGAVGMGAQRWLDLGFLQVQPSEIMKPALILALAHYFHSLGPKEVGQSWRLVPPLLLVLAPTALVLKQPDLGTALMLLIVAGAVFFVAGVRWWKFVLVLVLAAAAAWYAWESGLLHDYQKARILTFLDPEADRRGAGYHIIQSKIALGSGGVWGKGFLRGTQSHLDFLPERHTDFIFTTYAEEFGLIGGLALLLLYAALVLYGILIALRSKSQFGKLLAYGLSFNLFASFFINTAMVMGLIPVVGVPLPLISYGGTSLLSVLGGFGLIMAVHLARDRKIGRD